MLGHRQKTIEASLSTGRASAVSWQLRKTSRVLQLENQVPRGTWQVHSEVPRGTWYLFVEPDSIGRKPTLRTAAAHLLLLFPPYRPHPHSTHAARCHLVDDLLLNANFGQN